MSTLPNYFNWQAQISLEVRIFLEGIFHFDHIISCYQRDFQVSHQLLILSDSIQLINSYSGQKQSDNLDEILEANAKLGKYLREEYHSELNENFVKSFSL